MNKIEVFLFELSNDVLIMTPQGSFMDYRDEDIRNGYNEAYRLLYQSGTRHLLIDFSNFDYFGSTFVGILLNLAKAARKNSGETALCHLSETMRDMLSTLMLLENRKINFSMTPYPNREAALSELAEISKGLESAG